MNKFEALNVLSQQLGINKEEILKSISKTYPSSLGNTMDITQWSQNQLTYANYLLEGLYNKEFSIRSIRIYDFIKLAYVDKNKTSEIFYDLSTKDKRFVLTYMKLEDIVEIDEKYDSIETTSSLLAWKNLCSLAIYFCKDENDGENNMELKYEFFNKYLYFLLENINLSDINFRNLSWINIEQAKLIIALLKDRLKIRNEFPIKKITCKNYYKKVFDFYKETATEAASYILNESKKILMEEELISEKFVIDLNISL